MRAVRAGCGGWTIAALIAGCASSPARPAPAVNTGLSSLLSDRPTPPAAIGGPPPRSVPPDPFAKSDLAELLRQQAIDTQRILDGQRSPPPAESEPLGINRPPDRPRTRIEGAAPSDIASAGGGAIAPAAAVSGGESAGSPAGGDESEADLPEPIAPAQRSLDQRIDDAAVVLVDLLRQRAARSPGAGSMLALAALEAVRPGAFPRVLGSDASADPLTPAQRALLDSFAELSSSLRAAAADDATLSAGEQADRLEELALRAADALPIRIREARLCTRVLGFGQVAAFAADRFVAGRPQRAIVYVEIDRFARRELRETESAARDRGDRWAVELSMEINLYSDAGSLLVLRHPPERVVETSRARRRDFFLVREITLPSTLAAGRYNLKVTVRDETDGAVAERVIPIEVVADPSLIGGSGPDAR